MILAINSIIMLICGYFTYRLGALEIVAKRLRGIVEAFGWMVYFFILTLVFAVVVLSVAGAPSVASSPILTLCAGGYSGFLVRYMVYRQRLPRDKNPGD